MFALYLAIYTSANVIQIQHDFIELVKRRLHIFVDHSRSTVFFYIFYQLMC